MKIKFFLPLLFLLASCSYQKQLGKVAKKQLLNDSSLVAAHIGISIYEPATGKYWYNYQHDKYFVPASNVKIPTCYVAMKYLGDSLVAGRIAYDENGVIHLDPSGDPTFLHPDFKFQPLFQLLKGVPVRWYNHSFQTKPLGNGWSWNDYEYPYMAERSPLPVYGNLMTVEMEENKLRIFPRPFAKPGNGTNNQVSEETIGSDKISVVRELNSNELRFYASENSFTKRTFPFRATEEFISGILEDTTGASVQLAFGLNPPANTQTIRSQPTDSLLKPMMHRSDNFFAEQSLLMAGNELLGVMNESKIIDTILKTDFKDLPDAPRWVDGSGLSRYNLFSPRDFVSILEKMRNEFGMERIMTIFPTGGTGTLANYYHSSKGRVFAKTGTLSGVVALSGFLYTKKNKLLVFSVLVNNHRASATEVRRAVEKFIEGMGEKY